MSNYDLVRGQSAESVCAQRDLALGYFRAGLELLVKADAAYSTAVQGFPQTNGKTNVTGGMNVIDRYDTYSITDGKIEPIIEKYRRQLDAAAWRQLRDITGLRNLMDKEAMDSFDKVLEEDPPALTIENIQATFGDAKDNATDTFERGVINVYRQIVLDAQHLKTNRTNGIGVRFVLRDALDSWGHGMSYGSGKRELLVDLERIFYVVDGLPPPDHMAGAAAEVNTHARATGSTGVVETKYFRLKLHKNRNLHVEVLNEETLAKVNRIIAKHHPRSISAATSKRKSK